VVLIIACAIPDFVCSFKKEIVWSDVFGFGGEASFSGFCLAFSVS